jgi:hypothetical protein
MVKLPPPYEYGVYLEYEFEEDEIKEELELYLKDLCRVTSMRRLPKTNWYVSKNSKSVDEQIMMFRYFIATELTYFHPGIKELVSQTKDGIVDYKEEAIEAGE